MTRSHIREHTQPPSPFTVTHPHNHTPTHTHTRTHTPYNTMKSLQNKLIQMKYYETCLKT
jgi:hypothetical protein